LQALGMKRSIALLLLMLSLSGCAHRYTQQCVGEADESLNILRKAGAATHGPRTKGEPARLNAQAKSWSFPDDQIPALYIFDEQANFVQQLHPQSGTLQHPAFVAAEKEAYWGELVDKKFNLVPWVDVCRQASLFSTDLSFTAPKQGLLFMQYYTPDCATCADVDAAIAEFVKTNPKIPVRWVKVTVNAAAK
jgi:hypothetical protein